MKKVLFWLIGALMIAPIFLTSCSKDDEKEEIVPTSDLIGTWQSVSYSVQYKLNGEVYESESEISDDTKIEFKKDGTYSSYEYYDGEWEWYENGQWKYADGKLIITYEEEGEKETLYATVKTLTASKLVLEITVNEIEEGYRLEITATIEFEKILK